MLAILAAVMLAAAPGNDTVYTANGGRLVGTVLEESPQGISVQLPDGTTRRLSRNEVTRIEYSDGSVSTPSRAAPPAQPPQYRAPPAPPPTYAQPRPPPPTYAQPPPPSYRPPPPPYGGNPPPYAAPRSTTPALMPFWLSFGIGGSFPSGDAAMGAGVAGTPGAPIPMDSVFASQVGVLVEGGARLSPHLGLGLYLDLGYGDAGSGAQADPCGTASPPGTCSASTGRFGPMLRYTFDPYAASTPWIAIGTGWEWGSVNFSDTGQEALSYHGWEMLRLMGGVDLRSSPVFGIGLYGGVSFGRYTHYDEPVNGLSYEIGDQRTHTTFEAGLRFTLFP